jgi:MFS family permease
VTVETRADGSWADVVGEGRLPRFILICLGVWLHAADSLVTATIMPSVGADLDGYAYFGWATAGYLLGSVIAGASSALLALRFGLRRATAWAALLYAFGCAMSAAAPDMMTFLVGRLVQGLGGGWIAGFCAVAIGVMFPDRLLAKVYASTTSVWGVATLIGPLIGGVFAGADAWRWVFWFFAIQGVAVGAASLFMLPVGERGRDRVAVAWPQLAIVAAGISAIGAADLAGDVMNTVSLTVFGLALLFVMVWMDGRMSARLLPRGGGSLSTAAGSGYATIFLLTAASMGFSVYGPAILQTLRGYSPLFAGYVVALEALGWTAAGLAVAHLSGRWPTRLILWGTFFIVVGLALCAVSFPGSSLLAVAVASLVMGGGFGLSWSFMCQRILTSLPADERGLGAAGITTVRLTGLAAGAAGSAAVANLLGFSHALTPDVARSAAVWVFVAAVPVAMLGMWTARRLVASAR